MKCDNCQEVLAEESKFCNSCGAKTEVKETKEENIIELAKHAIRDASVTWFTIGFIKGDCAKSEKTKKYFKENIEKWLKKNPKFAEQYDYINSEYNKMLPQKKKK